MASSDVSLFAAPAGDDHRKEKSPSALRTISEASDQLGVPQHVLRFWETKFAQIRPIKRNGGRRFYRPRDLEILQQVKHLLYTQGYTIKGAKKAIEEFARHAESNNPADWQAPPANVNDNAPETLVAPPAEDILAELAEALNDEGEDSSADSKASLRELRDDLARARDALRALVG